MRAAPHLVAASLIAGLATPWTDDALQAQTAPERVLLEDFSGGLSAWGAQPLDRHPTDYWIATFDGNPALASVSRDGATALVRRLAPSAVAAGRLRWRWRVASSLIKNANEREKPGDDYAARLFVLFGDSELSDETRALAYVWAGREAVGSVYPNPYFPRVSTLVLRSGNSRSGEWVTEDRDLAADYERAFGEPAPDVGGLAILVDTDDTGATAMAWFDDVELWLPPTVVRP